MRGAGAGLVAGAGCAGRAGGVGGSCAWTAPAAAISIMTPMVRFITVSSIRRNVGDRCAQARNDVALFQRAVDDVQIGAIGVRPQTDDLCEHELEILE